MAELAPRNHVPQALASAPKCAASDPRHDRLLSDRLTGALALQLDVLSPVHVGTGEFEPHDGRLTRAAITRAGVPVIPGTSLKGACRQVFESLTDSDSPFDRDGCRCPRPPRKADDKSPRLRSRAAALFGELGHQGHAGFDDAEPIAPVTLSLIHLSVPYPPQHATGRRFYGLLPAGAQQERQVPALAIPAGARLRSSLRLRNVTPEELGGLLVSLGVGLFVLRVGGGRYDGYGCVRVSVVDFALRTGAAVTRAAVESRAETVAQSVTTWIQAFRPTCREEHLDELCRRLVEPAGDRGQPC